MIILPLPGFPFTTLSAEPAGQFFPPPVAIFAPAHARPPAPAADDAATPMSPPPAPVSKAWPSDWAHLEHEEREGRDVIGVIDRRD